MLPILIHRIEPDRFDTQVNKMDDIDFHGVFCCKQTLTKFVFFQNMESKEEKASDNLLFCLLDLLHEILTVCPNISRDHQKSAQMKEMFGMYKSHLKERKLIETGHREE